MKLWLSLFATLSLVSAPALSAPAYAPDPAAISAAEKLLDAMHYDTTINRTIDALVADSRRTMGDRINANLDTPLPPDLISKINAVVEKHIRNGLSGHRADMRKGTVLIYASRFTPAELQRLAELQSDPVMLKMQQQLPQITTEAMALAQAIWSGEQPGAEREVKELVIDYLKANGASPAS